MFWHYVIYVSRRVIPWDEHVNYDTCSMFSGLNTQISFQKPFLYKNILWFSAHPIVLFNCRNSCNAKWTVLFMFPIRFRYSKQYSKTPRANYVYNECALPDARTKLAQEGRSHLSITA